MITYKSGDVVLVPFPFTDLSTLKQRPAVILSSSKFNKRTGDCIMVAITSHIPQKAAVSEYILSESEQSLIRKQLGKFSPQTRKRVIEILMRIVC